MGKGLFLTELGWSPLMLLVGVRMRAHIHCSGSSTLEKKPVVRGVDEPQLQTVSVQGSFSDGISTPQIGDIGGKIFHLPLQRTQI